MEQTEKVVEIRNENISNVFGQFDKNVKKIEKEYGVKIVNRGEGVKVVGDKVSCDKAYNVLQSLNNIAEKGEVIGDQNVEYFMQSADEEFSQVERIYDDAICLTINGRPVKPKTLGQKKYIDLIRDNTIVFGIGPAGTGKTYLAMAMAITAFKNNEVNRIILTRPAIEAGEKLGFLPGDLQQKVDPYLRPLYDTFYKIINPFNITIV